MRKKVWIGICAGAAFIALLVLGWFALAPDNSALEGAGANSTPSPSASSPSEQPKQKELSDEELKKAAKEINSLDDVKAVEFFTAEETEEALVVAQEYARDSLSNGYFLSGKWVESDFDMSQVDLALGSYFSNELRAEFKTWDDEGKKDTISQKDLLPIVFYVGDNGEIEPSKYCDYEVTETDKGVSVDEKTDSEEGSISCPINGVDFSEIDYSPQQLDNGETPGIVVTFSASADIPVTIKEGSQDAKTSVTYDYKLFLVKNNYQEETTNPKPFVIASYDTKVLAKKVTPLNAE